MSKKRIAINGFGRIGRAAFRVMYDRDDVEVVGVNDLTDKATLAHLLQYDSVYGKYTHEVKSDDTHLIVDGASIPVYSEKDPAKLPWGDLDVDVVLECTGIFRTKELAAAHTKAGAKRVVISAPAKDEVTTTLVKGVADSMDDKENVACNASCTTNCIAPVVKVVEDAFGIDKAMMTTVHAYTADQRLVDGPHKDLRRARAAAHNIVPTTTGAAIATTKVIPSLQGSFDGMAIRVPVITGSLSDLTFVTKKDVTVEEVNEVLNAAAAGDLSGVMEVTSEPIVSSDIIGNPASCIVDLSLTNVVGGNLLKVVAWYDNEWGYANRLVEIAIERL
ncbi:MAG: type I glyceraldehyde-3-phosphate dehydrogenase [Patescibacteria group bacterium]